MNEIHYGDYGKFSIFFVVFIFISLFDFCPVFHWKFMSGIHPSFSAPFTQWVISFVGILRACNSPMLGASYQWFSCLIFPLKLQHELVYVRRSCDSGLLFFLLSYLLILLLNKSPPQCVYPLSRCCIVISIFCLEFDSIALGFSLLGLQPLPSLNVKFVTILLT